MAMDAWKRWTVLFHLKQSPEPQGFRGTYEGTLDMPRAVGPVRPRELYLLPVPLFPWGPAVSQWQCHIGSLVPRGPAGSHWPLVSRGLHSVTLIPCFHEPLQCHGGLLPQYHNGPFVPWGLTMAEGSPAEPFVLRRPQSVIKASRIP